MLSEQPGAPPRSMAVPDFQQLPAHDRGPPSFVTPTELACVQERLPTVGLGVRVKLVALMAGVSFLVVSVLASYFPARQISELRAELRERASAYGRLASLQLRSAVAFKDKETAREVLGAITKDPLVKGAAIYTEQGTRLDGEGTLSDLAHSARRGFGQPRMFSLPGRILVTIPVRSLEGPRGTLVMELTTAPANAARAQLIRVALAIGSGALLLGTLLAWGIARSLATRVENIARAASEVAEGNLEQALDLSGPGFFAQFWDGRSDTVESQASGPILNPVEMALPSAERGVTVLKSMPEYRDAFNKAFPGDPDPVTFGNVSLAIGAFERRLTTPSRWDDYLRGNQAALSVPELEGLKVFTNIGCMVCHTGEFVGGAMYQKAGIVEEWPDQRDQGRFLVSQQEADRMMFKVPTLRNIAKTAPYFHDGSVSSLDAAVRRMGRYQLGLSLSDQEVSSIVTWLDALTGSLPSEYIKPPLLPPSTPGTPGPDPT